MSENTNNADKTSITSTPTDITSTTDIVEKKEKDKDIEETEKPDNDDNDNIYKRLKELEDQVNTFSFDYCSLIADIIMVIESELYKTAISKKMEFLVTDLNDSKNESTIFIITNILETMFNNTVLEFQNNETNTIIERVTELSTTIQHSRFCILQSLARQTIQLYLSLPRHNFLIDTEKKYTQSVLKYVNDALSKKRKEIPKQVLDMCNKDKCNDLIFTDPTKKNNKVFTFQTKINKN